MGRGEAKANPFISQHPLSARGRGVHSFPQPRVLQMSLVRMHERARAIPHWWSFSTRLGQSHQHGASAHSIVMFRHHLLVIWSCAYSSVPQTSTAPTFVARVAGADMRMAQSAGMPLGTLGCVWNHFGLPWGAFGCS